MGAATGVTMGPQGNMITTETGGSGASGATTNMTLVRRSAASSQGASPGVTEGINSSIIVDPSKVKPGAAATEEEREEQKKNLLTKQVDTLNRSQILLVMICLILLSCFVHVFLWVRILNNYLGPEGQDFLN